MGKSKITITGIPQKGPKINEDGTVELIFKNSMSEGVPKGLKSLGESIYFVTVAKKTWNKIAEKATKDSFYIINGEPKASVNRKLIPFISVVCFDASLKEDQKVSKNINKVDEKPVEEKQVVKKQKVEKTNIIQTEKIKEKDTQYKLDSNNKSSLPKFKPWYNGLEDKFVELNVEDIILTETTHICTKNINVYGLDKAYENGYVTSPVAVKKIDTGKYSLVTGIKYLIQCKLLNIKTIKAFITDLSHEEFVKEFNIIEKKR